MSFNVTGLLCVPVCVCVPVLWTAWLNSNLPSVSVRVSVLMNAWNILTLYYVLLITELIGSIITSICLKKTQTCTCSQTHTHTTTLSWITWYAANQTKSCALLHDVTSCAHLLTLEDLILWITYIFHNVGARMCFTKLCFKSNKAKL